MTELSSKIIHEMGIVERIVCRHCGHFTIFNAWIHCQRTCHWNCTPPFCKRTKESHRRKIDVLASCIEFMGYATWKRPPPQGCKIWL